MKILGHMINLFGTPSIKNRPVDCIPYMGTKRVLATKILNAIYGKIGNFERFYDVFGGGGAVSIAALQSGHEVYYNELNTAICELLKHIISGKELPNRWVSREEYQEKINNNDWFAGFLASIWSFGNNQSSYLYGKDIESIKKLCHEMIIDKSEQARLELETLLKISIPKNIKRLEWRKIAKRERRVFNDMENLERLQSLKQLQNLERLQSLKQLQNLERLQSLEILERLQSFKRLQIFEGLQITNLSYEEVSIKKNSVIYCDPPYKDTSTYKEGKSFDYAQFYNWCLEQKNPVFISGYEMPKEFKLVRSFKGHRSLLSATNNSKKVTENLYWNGEKWN